MTSGRWVDGGLMGLVVTSVAVLVLCAWTIGAHPALFHRNSPNSSLFNAILYYSLIAAPVTGGGAAFVLSVRRQWWWTLVALLIGLMGYAIFVLGGLWLVGGFRT